MLCWLVISLCLWVYEIKRKYVWGRERFVHVQVWKRVRGRCDCVRRKFECMQEMEIYESERNLSVCVREGKSFEFVDIWEIGESIWERKEYLWEREREVCVYRSVWERETFVCVWKRDMCVWQFERERDENVCVCERKREREREICMWRGRGTCELKIDATY